MAMMVKWKVTERYEYAWIDRDWILGLSWRRTPIRMLKNWWWRLWNK